MAVGLLVSVRFLAKSAKTSASSAHETTSHPHQNFIEGVKIHDRSLQE